VASGAVEGIEVRIHEETHNNSHRSRCADSISGVRGSGLRADDEYHNKQHDHHVNDFKQHEQLKRAPGAVPRIIARHAESEQESDRLPRHSSEARADHVVQATSHRPEECPAERPQTGVVQLVQSVATGPAGQIAEHSEPDNSSAVEKR
jgi:hypothetical protein